MIPRTTHLLEIAANSLVSALTAQAGGAHRVELCENLGQGGTTPSYGTLALARERLAIPLYVLIRPRAGDFLYSAQEAEVMLRDIALCTRLGCDGVVIGALEADGDIDLALCKEMITAAGNLGITFHRAFDATRDPAHALEQIIALGCERVLTSGGCADAHAGADVIAAHVQQAGNRLRVMAGAGLTPDNLQEVVQRTGASEFHASAKALQSSAMRFCNPRLSGLEDQHWQTSASQVARLLEVISL